MRQRSAINTEILGETMLKYNSAFLRKRYCSITT